MEKPQLLDFARLLQRHRMAAGLTQEELAEHAGLSTRGISDLERGVRRSPHRATVDMLADALDLTDFARTQLSTAARRGSRTGREPYEEWGDETTPRLKTHSPQLIAHGGFLGSLPIDPLVARDAERNRLLAAVDAASSGEGRLVLLAGEPGIGKTRLAQELTVHIAERGFLIGAGRCYEAEEAVPYFPFMEALEGLYAVASPALRAAAPVRWPDLTLLLPDALPPLPPGALPAHEQQQRLFRAVAAFIALLADEAPVALMLDDLQWSDASSLKLLHFVARRTRAGRVLLLGTYRDSEADRRGALENALCDLERDRLMERITLGRLNPEESQALIAATLGPSETPRDFSHRIHDWTEGNPFFMQQVVRALIEKGGLHRENGRWAWRRAEELEAPESIRSVIHQRLSRLPEAAQATLREASVLGMGAPFTFEDLQAMSGRADEELEIALEEARIAGLIREGRPDTYSFDHALTQSALHAELPGRRRRRLHLAVAEAIERLPDRLRERRIPDLAWHFMHGGDTERALTYALLAGEQAHAIHALPEAERQYRSAVRLAVEAGDSEREPEALEMLGGVLAVSGGYDESLEYLERSRALHQRRGDLEAEGRMVVRICGSLGVQGHQSEATDMLRLMAGRLEGRVPEPSRALTNVYAALAQILSDHGHLRESLAPAERASASARALLGHDELGAWAEQLRAVGLRAHGRDDEADQANAEATRLAEKASSLWHLGNALNAQADGLAVRGDMAEAGTVLERAIENAMRLGDPAHLAYVYARRSRHRLDGGAWAEGVVDAERAVEVLVDVDAPGVGAYSLSILGMYRLRMGMREEAIRNFEAAIASVQPGNFPWSTVGAFFGLVEDALIRKRPEDALAFADRITGTLLSGNLLTWNPAHLTFRITLARTHLVADDLSRAEEASLALVVEGGGRLVLAEALELRGRFLTTQCRWDEARQALDEALTLSRSIGLPFAEANILAACGEMLVAKGESQEGQCHLESARAIFEHLGARPYADRVAVALTHVS